jgi:hypothetical protein
VTNYLTKITQVRDQLETLGEFMSVEELVRIVMNGFYNPWAPLINDIVAQDKLPYFDRLWDDFI